MMRAVRKRLRALRRPLAHALLLVGLMPKFVVPVGYMPAAIAAGSPLMLCDAFAAVPATGTPATGHAHAGHISHTAPAMAGHADSAAAGAAGNPADEPAPQGADHHEWERCSLGGLAALAAITTEWQAGLEPAGQVQPGIATTIPDTRRQHFAFRSRAPPLS